MLTGLDTLVTTDWYKSMAMKFFINLVQPYPFFENISITMTYTYYEQVVKQDLNEFLLAFSMIIRIYLIVRFYMTCFSDYRQPRH